MAAAQKEIDMMLRKAREKYWVATEQSSSMIDNNNKITNINKFSQLMIWIEQMVSKHLFYLLSVILTAGKLTFCRYRQRISISKLFHYLLNYEVLWEGNC